jgi:hypothetical protein
MATGSVSIQVSVLLGRSGVGHSHRIGLGLLKSSAWRGAQSALPALAGIAHQGCARGLVEYASGQSFGPGGLLLKILRGHRCTSSVQVEANAFVPSVLLSGLRLCEGGHSRQALSRSRRTGLGEVSLRSRLMRFEPSSAGRDQPPCCIPWSSSAGSFCSASAATASGRA